MTQETEETSQPISAITTTTTTTTATAIDLSKDVLTEIPKYDSVDDATHSKWKTEMSERLKATGETFYEIILKEGASDDSLAVSMDSLKAIAASIGAQVRVIRSHANAEGNVVTEVLVRRVVPADVPIEVRVATVGNVDSGKSTLLGVLSNGALDDGRGSARASVFRHPHERLTGRTSSIGHEHLAYDLDGNRLGQDKKAAASAATSPSKCVELLDLAGHAKYLKTTLFGMTGHHPDYAMLVVGSNMGFIGMTKEHLGITLALKIPAILVVLKVCC